jgi:hypothetical protein
MKCRLAHLTVRTTTKLEAEAFVNPIDDPDTGKEYDGIPSWAGADPRTWTPSPTDGDDYVWKLKLKAETYIKRHCP